MFFRGALFTLSILRCIYSEINITCVQPIMQSGLAIKFKSQWNKIRSWH